MSQKFVLRSGFIQSEKITTNDIKSGQVIHSQIVKIHFTNLVILLMIKISLGKNSFFLSFINSQCRESKTEGNIVDNDRVKRSITPNDFIPLKVF